MKDDHNSVATETKLKYQRSCLNIREHSVFTVQVVEHWHALSSEIVEPPSLEVFKSHLDTVLGNQLSVAQPESEFGPSDLQMPLLTSILL